MTDVRADDVLVGMLTENTPRMLTQAIRLLRSLRWFGGELARARVLVCGVGPLDPEARASLEGLGAEVRTVSRFHPANPTANRHQLLAELLKEPEPVFLLLDCDTIVVRDPLPYLRSDAFQAKPAPTPTVTDEVFERLFAHFQVPKPPRSRIASFTGTPMIPYFNGGVMVIPRVLAAKLAPPWRSYNQRLADEPGLAAPCQRHIHQASMALALAETGIPCVDLPAEMNYQLNATHLTPPAGFADADPAIIHYHHLATDDGYLLPCPYPGAQARIDRFHERMRSFGLMPSAATPNPAASRPVVVLGMHRSGTSVVALSLQAMGIHAGRPDELVPADMFNPAGYLEHKDVIALDSEILKKLGASWIDTLGADVSRLSEEDRSRYAAAAKEIVTRSLEGHGPFLVKDPRMGLLVPFWRDVLRDPVFVIVWRDPLAVARSLATRDGRPLLASLAAWEHQMRTLLRDTADSPRLLVAYEEFLSDPARVARELHAGLTGFGIEGLTSLSEQRIQQLVIPDFNRSAIGSDGDTLLDESQRALVRDLRSGAVLREPVAPTPARTREMIRAFTALEALRDDLTHLRAELGDQLVHRDLLLTAVFGSRSWRLGHRLTGLARRLRGNRDVSAEERWRHLTRRTE